MPTPPTQSSLTKPLIGFILSITISLLVQIYLVPLFPFITESYPLYLPIGITTSILGSLFDFLPHLLSTRLPTHLFKLAHHLADLTGLYYLIRIFPFDFSLINFPALNSLLLFAFIIAFLALILAFIIDFIKLAVSIFIS